MHDIDYTNCNSITVSVSDVKSILMKKVVGPGVKMWLHSLDGKTKVQLDEEQIIEIIARAQ